MRTILSLFLLAALCHWGHSQVLNENFNTLPSGWMQNGPGTWSLSSTLDPSGGCVYTANETIQSSTVSIESPILNLSAAGNLTITFKAAIVMNNFEPPAIALYYASGSNAQFIARWGNGFVANTTHTMSSTFLGQPPLTQQHVQWQVCSHTVQAITAPAVVFIFAAELFNAGYVLLDSVVIKGQNSIATGLKNYSADQLSVFPNPVVGGKLWIENSIIANASLINALGQKCSVSFTSNSDKRTELSLGDLPAGVYLLDATTEDKTHVFRKIIIQ